MKPTDYTALYAKAFRILDSYTPLRVDCGCLCNAACCKGDGQTGMRLFPHEPTTLPVIELEDGGRLVVCDGTCNREERPLGCRIFPFFPTVDARKRIFVEPDDRGRRLCPLLSHSDELVFDKRFFKALKKVGRLLARDEECLAFLREVTAEIDTYRAFLG